MRKLITIVGAAIAIAIAAPGAALAAGGGGSDVVPMDQISLNAQGPPQCFVITRGGHTQEIPLRACQVVLATP